MADNTIDRLRRLALSATELKDLSGFPPALLEDYLNIIENTIILAEAIDEIPPPDNRKLEEINTEYSNNSVLFVKNGFVLQDNPNFTWNNATNILEIQGTITGKNRAKQYFFGGF